MGLSISDHNAVYLSTYDGSFRWKIKEPRPGSVQRVNKNGITVNEMVFDQLSGILTGIKYEVDQQYGNSWVFTIVDDKTYRLTLSVNSSSTFYFLNRLINADLDLKLPMLFKIFSEVENDKKKQVILISQLGKWIPAVYTKENQGDLPQMKQVMFKGKLEWDSTERDQFIREIIEKYIIPELPQLTVADTTAGEMPDGPPEDTDLPDWAKPENAAPQITQEAPKPAAPQPTVNTPKPTPEAPKPTTPPATATPAPKAPAKRRG